MGSVNFCGQSLNATIGTTQITWAQLLSNTLTNVTTRSSSYLRPDTAGAPLPWIYTVFVLFIHIPVVFIRVVRWEAVQHWSLVSTFFTLATYIQAYVSTQFDAGKVLVWTPIILVIDGGAMLQIFFLIIEAKKSKRDQFERCARCSLTYSLSRIESQGSPPLLSHDPVCKVQAAVAQQQLSDDIRCVSARPIGITAPLGSFSSRMTSAANMKVCWYRNHLNCAAVVAALQFTAVLILQIFGLAKAAQAVKRTSDPPLVSWCSPLFQPFGIAVVDGSCNIYNVNQSAHKGIGCITLPGHWQQQWLKGTMAAIIIGLVAELIDLLILSLVNGKRKIFQAVKLKRPWATMFAGVTVLIVTLIYGINYSLNLPPGVSESVTVLMDVQGPASYSGIITSAGLRGAIIAWSDGLFESWGGLYLGSWNN